MTHAELVERACVWLRGRHRCKCVVPESASLDERPDVIGWQSNGESIVVECKASVSDLRADSYKPYRKTSTGMGFYRWYLVPQGLVDNHWAPLGIGLAEIHGRRIKVLREAQPRQLRDWSAEIAMLLCRLVHSRDAEVLSLVAEVQALRDALGGGRGREAHMAEADGIRDTRNYPEDTEEQKEAT